MEVRGVGPLLDIRQVVGVRCPIKKGTTVKKNYQTAAGRAG